MSGHTIGESTVENNNNQKRRLTVLDVLDCIEKNCISLTRCLELGAQWDKVVSIGLVGPLVADDFVQWPRDGDLGLFKEHISSLFDKLGTFLH